MQEDKIDFEYQTSEGIIPEREKFWFSWQDIKYSVKQGNGKSRQILHGVTGSIKSGEILAIMGGSGKNTLILGAGKTTLLNVLAGRIGEGSFSGTITLDGKKRNKYTWRKDCAYVEQDDLMHANLTVEETLNFAAKFKLPDNTRAIDINHIVNEIIMDLGLNNCRKGLIGGEKVRGVSGGERKRVSIGQEIITTPHIIFLDEPTSGLDAFTAFNIISALKNIAIKRNSIIIMTIHQPRTDIINLIDKILLLSAGKTMWLGSTQEGLEHFSKHGYTIPPNTNPSDFFMDCITLDQRSPEKLKLSSERVERFKTAWDEYYKKIDSNQMKYLTISSLNEVEPLAKSKLREFFLLLKREFLLTWRDLSAIKNLFIQSCGVIVIFDLPLVLDWNFIFSIQT
jgi:ABC-type multidrug transport system ATPase subunit